jgi:3-hydroxyacyl-CoA dehydrogenase
MHKPIQRAVVIGAGTMGAQLAAHLANASVSTKLLDIVPRELTRAEKDRGLSLSDREVRNRFASEGLESAQQVRPAAFFTKGKRSLIEVGNLEDDLEVVSDADWVIEAIIENLEIKRDLTARLDEMVGGDTIVSTNTSGIPVAEIASGRSDAFRKNFLGTHFFNPPRYLRLLEVIPTDDTDPKVLERIIRFAEVHLGKGVVVCKDTPNFIGNRLGSVGGAYLMDMAIAEGYTVEEVDALTGPLIGRPKTASFRLLDLVGLDVVAHVRRNLAQAIPEDEAVSVLTSDRAEKVTSSMLERGWLGNKAGQGFYRRVEENGDKSFWPLNLETMEHEPPQKPRFESAGKAKDLPTVAERVNSMVSAEDRAGELVRNVIFHGLAYASRRIPEIAESPLSIDHAMRWGFMHEIGPFELWDQMGVKTTAKLMAEVGHSPASWVEAMLESGRDSFYQYEGERKTAVYEPGAGEYVELSPHPRELNLAILKGEGGELARNDSASLIDIGDDVLCLEFHSKGNSLDDDTFRMMAQALEKLELDYQGLVIANESDNFSFGANLFTMAVAAQNELWAQLEEAVRTFQELNMAMRHAPRPVVVAPAGMALAGGAEIMMHGARVVAAAESYIGLVEVGAGVIPAGGGTKEVMRRIINPVMRMEDGDVFAPMQKVFQTIGQGMIARSADDAREFGFLGEGDRVVMNRAHLIDEAKREVLHLAQDYRSVEPELIYAAGRDLLAALRMAVFTYREGDYISDYDAHVGEHLVRVLTGGDLSRPQWVDPWYILDLEREAFLSLAGEEKTQARMWHLLQTGKPLRN